MPRRRPMAPKPPTEETIRLVMVEPRAVLGAGVREILDREPDIEIVGEARTAAEAMQLVDATAPDVVLVDVPLTGPSSTEATRRVAEGEDPLKDELIARPDLVERIVDSVREAIMADRRPTNPMTPRELEVLGLVAEGLRNREIAGRLGVSEQTIKNQLSSVLHKLGVPNRTHAVTYAVRHGWLVPPEGGHGQEHEVGQERQIETGSPTT